MTREDKAEFRKFLNSPIGKKLLASTIIVDVDPQYTLEHYLELAFVAGRESNIPAEDPAAPGIDPLDVIKIYNEVFMRDIKPVPQRFEIVRGRLGEAKKTKIKLELKDFREMFEFKKKEAEGKEESWTEFETLCARKHFWKYLEKSKSKDKLTGKEKITVNVKLF